MSGVAAELTVAGGASFLGGEFTYLRVRGEVSGYLPLVPRTLSLAARIGAGAIRPFDDLGAPYLQRFRLGGAATVRGWGYEQLSPRVPGEDCGADDGCPDTPVGGNAMVLANLELRVYSRVGLGFAGFVDAGRVWESAFGGPADLQVSVGGGVRYRTPIGVVRLDAGVPVVRDPTLAAGQPGFGIHFGIGEAF
ncbi:outer membrane protein assembly factor [Myxococcota bacterium]|nr:outer membrane protein assembly factor [Myxococcota bacterium]